MASAANARNQNGSGDSKNRAIKSATKRHAASQPASQRASDVLARARARARTAHLSNTSNERRQQYWPGPPPTTGTVRPTLSHRQTAPDVTLWRLQCVVDSSVNQTRHEISLIAATPHSVHEVVNRSEYTYYFCTCHSVFLHQRDFLKQLYIVIFVKLHEMGSLYYNETIYTTVGVDYKIGGPALNFLLPKKSGLPKLIWEKTHYTPQTPNWAPCTFTSKLPISVDRSPNPITTCHSTGPIRPPSQTASDQPFCRNALDIETHTHTHKCRKTNG